MVGASDCALKSTVRVGKVSKPIMEKKRRARINKCLDQLKTLLESYYTSNIRKRKLEKADILELTVKHLRSLQKIQSCTSKASGFPDYQAGFSSCLADVHRYLSTVDDDVDGSDSSAPSRLVQKNPYCAEGRREASRTLDSDAGRKARDGAEQRPLPALNATDSRRTANMAAVGCFRATHDTRLNYGPLPAEVKAEGRRYKVVRVGPDSPSVQPSMWRPW